jgi:hypothetical protein
MDTCPSAREVAARELGRGICCSSPALISVQCLRLHRYVEIFTIRAHFLYLDDIFSKIFLFVPTILFSEILYLVLEYFLFSNQLLFFIEYIRNIFSIEHFICFQIIFNFLTLAAPTVHGMCMQ